MVIKRQIFTVLFRFEAHAPSSDPRRRGKKVGRKRKKFMLLEEAR